MGQPESHYAQMKVRDDEIAVLDARAKNAEAERDAAIRALSEASRKQGEAEGKLLASEMAGIVEGWKARVETLKAENERMTAAVAPKPDPAKAAASWRHTVEREKTMQLWDRMRSYIARGGGGSWPRDAFESLLDGYDEDLAALRARVETLEAERIEALAELIYLRRHGKDGAVWLANDSKDVWRAQARAVPLE